MSTEMNYSNVYSQGLAKLALTAGGLCFAAICVLTIPEASAGARDLEIVMTNMTPDDASSEDSKACVKRVRNLLTHDEVHEQYMGETEMRKLAGAPDKKVSFLSWKLKQLQGVRERPGREVDTVVLIDCRPEKKSIDLLLATSDDSLTRIQLRNVPLTPARLAWLSKELVRQAWVGFSP